MAWTWFVGTAPYRLSDVRAFPTESAAWQEHDRLVRLGLPVKFCGHAGTRTETANGWRAEEMRARS